MIEIKKDPYLVVFNAIVILAVIALILHKDIPAAEGLAILGAIFFPSVLGRGKGGEK